jgi:hypothetical protein
MIGFHYNRCDLHVSVLSNFLSSVIPTRRSSKLPLSENYWKRSWNYLCCRILKKTYNICRSNFAEWKKEHGDKVKVLASGLIVMTNEIKDICMGKFVWRESVSLLFHERLWRIIVYHWHTMVLFPHSHATDQWFATSRHKRWRKRSHKMCIKVLYETRMIITKTVTVRSRIICEKFNETFGMNTC